MTETCEKIIDFTKGEHLEENPLVYPLDTEQYEYYEGARRSEFLPVKDPLKINTQTSRSWDQLSTLGYQVKAPETIVSPIDYSILHSLRLEFGYNDQHKSMGKFFSAFQKIIHIFTSLFTWLLDFKKDFRQSCIKIENLEIETEEMRNIHFKTLYDKIDKLENDNNAFKKRLEKLETEKKSVPTLDLLDLESDNPFDTLV